MKIADIVNQLRAVLPKYTDYFSSTLEISTIVVDGGVATVETTSAHGLSTGANVTLNDVGVLTAISGVSKDGLVFTFTTTTAHDLTLGWQQTAELRGFTDDTWNDSFTLTAVPNRYIFRVRSTNNLPTLNGNEKLLEDRYDGINGRWSATVIDDTTFTVSPVLLDGTYSGGTVSIAQRIAGSLNIERAINQYTKHNASDFWLFVVPDDVEVSKDRNTYSDVTSTITTSDAFRLRLRDGFSVFIVANTKADIAAVEAVDICRHDLLLPILKSVNGLRFPTGLTYDSDFRTVLTSHNAFDYNRAYLVYEYHFEVVNDITNDDTVAPTDTRAFRDVDYTHAVGDDNVEDLTVTIDLDEMQPLITYGLLCGVPQITPVVLGQVHDLACADVSTGAVTVGDVFLSELIFYAPLVDDLVDVISGVEATFSRGTPATYTASTIHLAAIDEPRFENGSFLQEPYSKNWIVNSYGAENDGSKWDNWTNYFGTLTLTDASDVFDSVDFPDAKWQRFTHTFDGTESTALFTHTTPAGSFALGDDVSFTFKIKGQVNFTSGTNLNIQVLGFSDGTFEETIANEQVIINNVTPEAQEFTLSGVVTDADVDRVRIYFGRKIGGDAPIAGDTLDIYFIAAQVEPLPVATSHIPTTTAPEERASEAGNCYWPFASLHPAVLSSLSNVGTMLAQITFRYDYDEQTSTTARIISSSADNSLVHSIIDGSIASRDGTTTVAYDNNFVKSTTYNTANQWGYEDSGEKFRVGVYDGSFGWDTDSFDGAYVTSDYLYLGYLLGGPISMKNIAMFNSKTADIEIAQSFKLFATVFNFTANDLSAQAPTIGAVTLVEIPVKRLTTNSISAGFPVLDTPTLERHAGELNPYDLWTLPPVLGEPTMVVVVLCTTNDLSTQAPDMGAPTVFCIYALTTNDVATGAPDIPSFMLYQEHALAIADITTGTPTIDALTIGQEHNLTTADLSTQAPDLDTPTAQVLYNFSTNDLSTQAPDMGTVTASQGVTLTKDADADVSIDIVLSIPAGYAVNIDWGDGNDDDVIGPQSATTYNNVYASAVTDYTITISGDIDKINYFVTHDEPLSGDISGFSALANVVNLQIYNCSVSGNMASYSALTNLTSLNLSNTSVSGDVAELTALTSISVLNFANTSISGSIAGYSALTTLTQLQLHNTSVSGDVSGFSALTNLTILNLSGTSVTGSITSWSALTSLTYLACSSTAITGDVSGFSGMTSLTFVNLGTTSVTGSISWLGTVTANITHIFFYDTTVYGSIESFGALTTLTSINLRNTSVSGDISNLDTLISLVNLTLNNTSVSYTATTLPDWDGCTIVVGDCSWTQTEVDAFLCDLDSASTASIKSLNIAGDNSGPSGTGYACQLSLESKGWTVTANAPTFNLGVNDLSSGTPDMGTVTASQGVVLTKDADADVSTDIILSIPASYEVVIDWGDGNSDTVTGPQTQTTYSNTYASAVTDYTITIYGDIDQLTYIKSLNEPLSGSIAGFVAMPNLTQIQFNSTGITGNISAFTAITGLQVLSLYNTAVSGDISGFTSLPLTYVQLGNTSVSGSIAGWSAITSLTFLRFDATSVTGDVSGFNALTSLTTLSVQATSVTGSINAWGALTSLTLLSFGGTSMSGDVSNLSTLTALGTLLGYSSSCTYTTTTLPDWDACNINFNNCSWTQTEVDAFLCDLDTASTASTKELNMAGSNSAPSGTGTTCKTSLEGKGWTVTVST